MSLCLFIPFEKIEFLVGNLKKLILGLFFNPNFNNFKNIYL